MLWLISEFIEAYIYAVAAFLLLRLVFRWKEERTRDFLRVANGLALGVLFLNLLAMGLVAWRCPQCYGFDFYGKMVCTVLLGFLFQLLFLKKRHRENVGLTIASVLLLVVYVNYESLIILIKSVYRDYIPGVWSTYYGHGSVVQRVLFGGIYFGVCWFGRAFRLSS